MTESNPASEVDAAEAYESLFIPALFGEWAPRVADAAELGDGERVLDVACGTGILGREAARRVGKDGLVAGVDPSPGMLAVARRLAPTVDWQQGTAESLPFQDGSFDAVVSQFGLMLFEDRQRAVREPLCVLPAVGVALPEDVIRETLDDAEDALASYVTPQGSVSFATSAHIVTGEVG